jgi:hypothetical protein
VATGRARHPVQTQAEGHTGRQRQRRLGLDSTTRTGSAIWCDHHHGRQWNRSAIHLQPEEAGHGTRGNPVPQGKFAAPGRPVQAALHVQPLEDGARNGGHGFLLVQIRGYAT